MKIAAITKFKHGMLFEAMQRLKWDQARLAREAKLNQGSLGKICAMKTRPSHATCQKIHKAFLRHGVFFDVMKAWPQAFKGRKQGYAITQIQEIPVEQLQSQHESLMYETPNFGATHDYEQAMQLMDQLDQREAKVIKMKFLQGHTSVEIGRHLKVTPQCANFIEHRALRKLQWMLGDREDRAKCGYGRFKSQAA